MMRMICLSLVLLIVAPVHFWAVTADRIVVSIGNKGITESEVDQEVRFAQFLDGRPQSSEPSEAQRTTARDRLIEQTLLMEEAEADATDASALDQEANRLLNEVRSLYPDEASYRTAFESTGYTQAQAHERLVKNVQIVRLINRRLRPNAWVNQRDIEVYYRETFVPEHQREENTPPPKVEEVESLIREILIQQEVDRLLDEWIKEIQSARRVKLHSP